MAKKGSGPDLEKYKQLFKETDRNGDGYIDIQEFRKLMKRGGSSMSDRQIADSFVFFDGSTGDRRINFDEFVTGLQQIIDYVEKVKALFKEMDTTGDGYLDRDELKALLDKSGKKYERQEVNDILQQADRNGDNKISLDEFIDAVS